MGNLVSFPIASRLSRGEETGRDIDIHGSIRQALVMLELQILQIGRLVTLCPAGHARKRLEQEHNQLIERIAVAQHYARMMNGD